VSTVHKKILAGFFLITLLSAWFVGKVLDKPPDYLDKAGLLFPGYNTHYKLINNDPIVYEVYENDSVNDQ